MAAVRLPITLALVSYHKADVIGLVIESAARGSMPPDLIVVSDDGSSDGTPDVAEEACRRVGIPCRTIRHHRVGLYRLQTMRNSAVAESLDGVVMISDSDCIFDELSLEAHHEIHRQNPFAIGTGARFEYLEGTGGDFTSMYSTLEFANFPTANYIVPYGANISFRKSLWRQLGGFDRAYEGRYGFDDHEFVLRAELAGAVVVSDPGAYVFHCPHDTVFGNRDPGSNATLFRRQFSRDYGMEQAWFINEMALPWYWGGNRKASVLGRDRLEFDAWGAPAGYHPPAHLALVVDHRILVDSVDRALASWNDETLLELRQRVHRIDPGRILRSAPAHELYMHLRRTMDCAKGCTPWLRSELTRWLEWTAHVRPLSAPTVVDRASPATAQPATKVETPKCESA